MYPKIIDVNIENDYALIVTFDNQTIKRFDVAKNISDYRLDALKDKSLFKRFKIDNGGYGISWNDEIDISEYELWSKGESIKA